jgi:hypothetical protein
LSNLYFIAWQHKRLLSSNLFVCAYIGERWHVAAFVPR